MHDMEKAGPQDTGEFCLLFCLSPLRGPEGKVLD